jgi:hypothetical protein
LLELFSTPANPASEQKCLPGNQALKVARMTDAYNYYSF